MLLSRRPKQLRCRPDSKVRLSGIRAECTTRGCSRDCAMSEARSWWFWVANSAQSGAADSLQFVLNGCGMVRLRISVFRLRVLRLRISVGFTVFGLVVCVGFKQRGVWPNSKHQVEISHTEL
ncbi:hypothetical protein Droror1_Dr00025661 [Drosera rotundifolia]